LLSYDNYEGHLLYIEVLELVQNNGVTVLTSSPHLGKKLQPLDVGVFKHLKTFYSVAVDSWLMQHPCETFSIYSIAGCVNAAHQKAITPGSIVAAFHTTRIFPYDRVVFTEADFLSSFVTGRPSKCHKNH
jgi:hypothetical protein